MRSPRSSRNVHEGAPPWLIDADHRCLRGLMFVYRLQVPACQHCFFAAIDARWPTLAHKVERLGALRVHARALPFGFELRVGLRGPDVELIHRFTATADDRERAHAGVEAALVRAVGCDGLGQCATR